MNSLLQNTSLNTDIIKIIDLYAGLTEEFIIKTEEMFNRQLSNPLIILMYLNEFIGLFTTRELAVKHMIRLLINWHIYHHKCISRNNFITNSLDNKDIYDFLIIDHIDKNKTIYYRQKKSKYPLNLLTNDKEEAILSLYDQSYPIENCIVKLDPKLPELILNSELTFKKLKYNN